MLLYLKVPPEKFCPGILDQDWLKVSCVGSKGDVLPYWVLRLLVLGCSTHPVGCGDCYEENNTCRNTQASRHTMC